MTSLSEQLSAVRQSQWETQLDMLHSLSSRAIDSAEQLIALNMKTSRASVEQATGTLKQLLEVTNPRDLAALGSVAQGQWQHVLDYSRALFGIAAGGHPAPGLFGMPAVTLPSNAPQAFKQLSEQLSIATAAAASRTTEIASAAADTGAALAEATLHAGAQEVIKAKEAFTAVAPEPEPEIEEVTELDAETAGAGPDETPAAPPAEAPAAAAAPAEPAAVAPPVEPTKPAAAAATPATAHGDHTASTTPLGAVFENAAESAITEAIPLAKPTQVADAVHQLATHALGAEHPSAATLPLDNGAPVETPHMTPVDSTPPPVAVAAPQAKPPRASRKK